VAFRPGNPLTGTTPPLPAYSHTTAQLRLPSRVSRETAYCAAGGFTLTPQEEQLLQSLAERVNTTQLEEKDPDAEAFLNKNLAPNPDAIYILAQSVLVQNIALDQAKAQISQLQQQLQQPRQPAHASSFLGNLLGRHDPEPAQPQPNYAPAQSSGFQPVQQGPFQPQPQFVGGQPQYVAVAPGQPAYGQPVYGQPVYGQPAYGQPSFLRGAMQTAAGVAAGALAFEGVESILHGFGGGPGFGMGGPAMGLGGAGFERPAEETVINNYYDQPGGSHEGGEQHFHESADQNTDQGGAQFSDASYDTSGNDRDFNDRSVDNSSDDSNFDSGTGLDDNSGSFDNGGDDSSNFDDGGGGFGDSNFQ
jgi:uncharacterized protein